MVAEFTCHKKLGRVFEHNFGSGGREFEWTNLQKFLFKGAFQSTGGPSEIIK